VVVAVLAGRRLAAFRCLGRAAEWLEVVLSTVEEVPVEAAGATVELTDATCPLPQPASSALPKPASMAAAIIVEYSGRFIVRFLAPSEGTNIRGARWLRSGRGDVE
jgi:hypothetical protein